MQRAGDSGDGVVTAILGYPLLLSLTLKPCKAGGSALRVTAVTVVTVILGYPAALSSLREEHPVNAKYEAWLLALFGRVNHPCSQKNHSDFPTAFSVTHYTLPCKVISRRSLWTP